MCVRESPPGLEPPTESPVQYHPGGWGGVLSHFAPRPRARAQGAHASLQAWTPRCGKAGSRVERGVPRAQLREAGPPGARAAEPAP